MRWTDGVVCLMTLAYRMVGCTFIHIVCLVLINGTQARIFAISFVPLCLHSRIVYRKNGLA